MTLVQLVNAAALLLVGAIAFWRGRTPERVGMAIIAAAFLITPLVERRDSWLASQVGILVVDAATLVALIALAAWCARYWAVWASAFQAVAVLTDLAFLIDPRAVYRAYYFGNFSIGFLLLGAILGGALIERDRPFRRQPRRRPSARSTPRPV
jgi:hypothetical protein